MTDWMRNCYVATRCTRRMEEMSKLNANNGARQSIIPFNPIPRTIHNNLRCIHCVQSLQKVAMNPKWITIKEEKECLPRIDYNLFKHTHSLGIYILRSEWIRIVRIHPFIVTHTLNSLIILIWYNPWALMSIRAHTSNILHLSMNPFNVDKPLFDVTPFHTCTPLTCGGFCLLIRKFFCSTFSHLNELCTWDVRRTSINIWICSSGASSLFI